MKRGVLTILSLLVLTNLSATQFQDLDTTRLLHFTLSSKHHNRIAIDGGRIKKVIFPEGNINIKLEEESGQIFVSSLICSPPETTISIVTNEDTVQDLSLTFSDRESEILILKEPPEWEPDPCPAPCSVNSSDHIICLVESILKGYVPNGYIASLEDQQFRQLTGRVYAQKKAKLIGPYETLHIWTITNYSRQPRTLREDCLNFDQGNWVYLDRNCLKPKEQATVIISVKHDE